MCKLQFTTHERFLVYLPRVEFSNPEHLSGRGAAKFSLTAHAASFTGLSLRSRSDDLRSRPSLYLYACSSLRSAHGGFWSALSSVFLRSALCEYVATRKHNLLLTSDSSNNETTVYKA